LIQGLAGSGKTTLACQIGFEQAAKGKKVIIYTLIAETHGKMLNHLGSFSFFNPALVGRNLLLFSGYNELSKKGLSGLLHLIATTLAEHNADVLIIDGFRSVRESNPKVPGLSEFMLSLSSLVSSMECTTFLLSPTEGNVADSENTLVDGLIELSQYEKGMQLIRELKIFKIRGAKHLLGRHIFEMGRRGIVVYPRLEAISNSRVQNTPNPCELMRFGISGWDAITNGGVNKGSTTELLGNPGVGKTIMGLHFIQEGLQRGETCLIAGFYESPDALLNKAASLGIHFQSSIDSGHLTIIWRPPLEVLVDEFSNRILRHIDEYRVSRLFIDGMDGLLDIILHCGRPRAFLTAFVNELRSRQVTTFITRELPYLSEIQAHSAGPTSILYENIMLLRYIEISDINYRQINVLKLRQNGYDAANHIFSISNQGITIGRSVLEEKLALRALHSRPVQTNTQ
jgi:circadian clock protein KaiC